MHDALAWLSQVSMFLMMGLLVFPSALLPIAGVGLSLALILAFVARPLAVILCIWPFKYPAREVVYLSWVGLRGSVPIILATFPVLAGVAGADRIFNVVFFIVVLSTLLPGTTVRLVTKWLRVGEQARPIPGGGAGDQLGPARWGHRVLSGDAGGGGVRRFAVRDQLPRGDGSDPDSSRAARLCRPKATRC